MLDKILNETSSRMQKAIDATVKELSKLRTGKATPALIDGIKVDYYGTEMPINQVASVAVPEARLIVIQPWDKNALEPIVKAIQTSDLNLPPQSDGNVIRLVVPQLTEDRRKELTKIVGKVVEEGKISIRNIRRDAIDQIKSKQNSGDIPEDNAKKGSEDVQDLTDKFTEKLDDLKDKKEKEILTL